MPPYVTAMASTPAAGPRPKARTSSSAQTISGIPRNSNSVKRARARKASPRPRPGPGPMREIDRLYDSASPSGAASSMASAVPAVAMARVSMVALSMSCRNSVDTSGGKNCPTNPPITLRLRASSKSAGRNCAICNNGHNTSSAASTHNARPRASGSRSGRVVDVFMSSRISCHCERSEAISLRLRNTRPIHEIASALRFSQ